MRPAVRWILVLLVVGLVAGHILYWYMPRERASAPEPGGLAAHLLASPDYDACFWIPYPHQNLAVLADALGDWQGYVGAVSRLAGLPPPNLPGFGPFAVPPASEIAACSDAAGGRAVVVAEIYPLIALVAKAAGHLAGNPWLAGGEVADRQPPARVTWQGSEWRVSLGGEEAEPSAPPAGSTAGALDSSPADSPRDALALLRLSRPVSGSFADLPAGTYRLERPASAPADLELVLAGGGSAFPSPAVPEPDRPVLLAAAAAAAKGPASALALYPAEPGGDLGLPGAATFQAQGAPGKGRWSLPGGGLASFLSKAFLRGAAAGWSIVAFDARSLARAESLAPGLAALVPPAAAPLPGGPSLRLGLWLAPAPALALVTSVRQTLEKVPLVSRREVDRWRDGETLLAPLAHCRELSAASAGPPDAFALRLTGCR